MSEKEIVFPGTLELTTAAAHSANFLARNTDERHHHLPYFKSHYGQDPVINQHTHWDFCENTGRYLYAAALVRQQLGPGAVDEAAARQLANIVRHTGPNGLNFRPTVSPFAHYRGGHPVEGPGTKPESEYVAEMWDNRSVFMGLFLWGLAAGDGECLERAGRMVEALGRLVIREKGFCRLAQVGYPPDYRPDPGHPGRPGEHMAGWISGLVNWHRHTGDELALELAAGFSRYHLAQGALTGEGPVQGRFNTHSALFLCAGMLRLGRLTGEREMIAAAKSAVDWYLEHESSSFGWVSESLNRWKLKPGENESAETCAVADALDCAVQLARAGWPEYWNVVERFARNYLDQAQLRDVAWLPARKPAPAPIDRENWRGDPDTFLTDDVPNRIRGCYVGWGAPNDFVNPSARASGQYAIMHCCGPHGAYANWLAWNRIITREDGLTSVNLLLNRRSALGAVASWLPHEGKVAVTPARNGALRLRVPDWADRDRVRLQAGEKELAFGWDGPFARLEKAAAGQTVTLTFPVAKRERRDRVEGVEYVTRWRGDTVVGISPAGKIHPFFDRERLDTDQAPPAAGPPPAPPEKEIDW